MSKISIKPKIVSICIVTILSIALAVNCFADITPFTDIANIGFKDKIITLQDRGYIKGVGNNLFAPNNLITAAEGIQLFVNTFKLNIDNIRFIKAPKATDYFVKADNDAWYASALIIASMNNLDLSNDIDPNQKWTREQFTYQLIRAIENHASLPMIKLDPVLITDQDQLAVDYSGAIQQALAYKIVQLDAEEKFNPKDEITRAEAADQIYNALEYIKIHSTKL